MPLVSIRAHKQQEVTPHFTFRSFLPMIRAMYRRFALYLSSIVAATALPADTETHLRLGDRALREAMALDALQHYQEAFSTLASEREPELEQALRQRIAIVQCQAASNYAERQQLYQKLLEDTSRDTSFLSRALLQQGQNELSQAQMLQKTENSLEAERHLQRAAQAFSQAFTLCRESHPHDACQALVALILCQSGQGASAAQRDAIDRLNYLLAEPTFASLLAEPDQLYFLRGQLLANEPNATASEVAAALHEVMDRFPQSRRADAARYQIGMWYFHHGDYTASQRALQELADRSPSSPLAAEALFWAARSAEQQGANAAEVKALLTRIYRDYPNSPLAAEAYFTTYSYEDYLSDNREALTHLSKLTQVYPDSPFTIVAHYLRGLAHKRGQLEPSTTGKGSSWNNAIDAFQRAEDTFVALHASQQIPADQLDYFATIRTRAMMERAQANLAIALASNGAKRQVSFAYSISTYQDLLKQLRDAEFFLSRDSSEHLIEECRFGLAQVHQRSGDDSAAEAILQQIIADHESNGVTRGYYLARAHHDVAAIQMRRRAFSLALAELAAAEEAAKGRIFSTDERLALWIRQSHCHRELLDLDTAMRLLSKVINDDSVSGLRLKAMYLRAEIYEQEGRHELARKQLASLSSRGGEWALKAKTKLDKDYGHQ